MWEIEPYLVVSFVGEVALLFYLPTDVQSIAGNRGIKIISLTPSVNLHGEVKLDEGEDEASYYRGVLFMLLLSFLTYP